MSPDAATTPLEELCEAVIDCPHSTPVWMDQGVIVLRSSNIRNGRLDLGNPSFTDDYHYEERSKRAWIQAGDLVITREAPMGEVCLIPENLKCCLGQRMVMLRPNKNKRHGKYLLYALQSSRVQNQIKSHEGTGSTVSNLRIPVLKELSIPSPSIASQKAIAHILGNLDNKIELNRKTNETLEAMAKALFKSWFVDFDPVRAKAEGRPTGLPAEISDLFPDSFEDSELGEIPSGWSASCVNDLCESVSSGGTPSRSRKDFWENGNIPWFKTGELKDAPLLDSSEKIIELAPGNSSCKLWEAGAILFAIYASPTVGRLGVLTASGTSNQAAAGLKANGNIGTPFLRRALFFSRDELQNIAVGAAQQNINVQILKEHKVIAPGTALANVYGNTVSPLVSNKYA